MEKAEKDFRRKFLQILLQSGNVINDRQNEVVWKMAHILKQYKNTTYSDVWDGNTQIKKKIDELLNEYSGHITNHIRKQTKSIWEACSIKNDLLIRNQIESTFIGDAGPEVSVSKVFKWFDRTLPENIDLNSTVTLSANEIEKVLSSPRNNEALEAFLNRQVNGIKLSERVWKLQETQFQPILESWLADGVEAGKSASEISRDIRSYLDQPEKLFRRVRSKVDGKLRLSKAAKDYNPGQGIYRSSYKNALRLARNEVNLAYRASDFDRWQKLDFVLGVNIELSEQHPVFDICDTLQGDYPRGFNFTSWHPQCLCHATPIMMPREDFKKYIAGQPVKVNKIDGTPDNFNNWLEENKERIEGWKSQPYFLKYNEKYVNQIINT